MPAHTECRADFDAEVATRAACDRARLGLEHLTQGDGVTTRLALRVALSDVVAHLSNAVDAAGPANARVSVLRAFMAAEDACSYTGPANPRPWAVVIDVRDTVAVLYARLALEARFAR